MWKVGFESYLSVKLKRTIIMALNHIFKCKLKKCVNKVNLELEKVSSKVIIKNCKDKRVSRFKWFLTLSPHKLSKLFPYVFEFLMTSWSFPIGIK